MMRPRSCPQISIGSIPRFLCLKKKDACRLHSYKTNKITSFHFLTASFSVVIHTLMMLYNALDRSGFKRFSVAYNSELFAN
jgi:hypothetical protein